MMKRLVEQTDSRHPLVVRAAKLLDSAEPAPPSDAMRRRVLVSVVRERPTFGTRRSWIARPATVFAVLLATTAAAASFHEGWLPRVYRLAVEQVGAHPPSAGAAEGWRASSDGARIAGSSSAETTETVDPPSQAALESSLEASLLDDAAGAAENGPGAIAEADIALDLPGAGSASRLSSPRRARKSSKATPARSAWDDGAGLVLTAMDVLRRQHDAARASQLLEQYLGAYPRGALREEAMALAVEAASARGDGRESRRLAARYEQSFPDGRFRPALRSITRRGSP